MNPKCEKSENTDTILQHKSTESAEISNECVDTPKTEEVKEEKVVSNEKEEKETSPKEIEEKPQENKTRKSTRSTRFKSKVTRQKSTKSVSRRSNIFKSAKPFKTPSNICAETRTRKRLFVDGFYYQIGDIVAVWSRGERRKIQISKIPFEIFKFSSTVKFFRPTIFRPNSSASRRHILRKIRRSHLANSNNFESRSKRGI